MLARYSDPSGTKTLDAGSSCDNRDLARTETPAMISVIVPAFNESDGIALLYQRLTECAAAWKEDYEVLMIDDGSKDNTLQLLEEIAAKDSRWKILSLSRNFGHQPAVTAGLEHARGDLVAVIDADLQDPPEELPRFFAKCREGYDVVFGIRTKRKEGPFKRFGYWLFYRIMASMADIEVPLDSGDFCVMSRRCVDALNSLPERSRFIRALRSWVGFRQTGLIYERHARAAGAPKYTFSKLANLAMDGIINFSYKPLRMISVAGMIFASLSILLGIFVIVQYFADWTVFGYNPRQAHGWTSLMIAILFITGVQLFCLGVIGEYIGRLFDEIKRRPVYLVGKSVNLEEKKENQREVESNGRKI
jgi:glycosyltransferase involved in cell wall biosynthesis